MALTDRQQQILLASIREHVKTAKPVASEMLVGRRGLDVSSASIRNDMLELENAGYLAQPHTSAGRIPTAKAYQFYLDHFLERNTEPSKSEQDAIRSVVRKYSDHVEQMKMLAKTMAGICETTVIISFAQRDVYYTGISYLFHQPEFAHLDSMLSMSDLVDHLDDVVADVFDTVTDEPAILVGPKNPFGEDTGVLLAKYGSSGRSDLVGILGPLRMAYDENLSILRFAQHCLSPSHA